MSKRHANPDVPCCPYCNKPLIRVFESGGIIKCNECNERLDRSVGSNPEDGKYVKCPYCGYEGEELVNPTENTICPKCNRFVLKTVSNLKGQG